MYANDNGGYLAPYEDGWVARVGSYGKRPVDPNGPPENEFACPSQPFTGVNGLSPAATWHGSTYGINQHIASSLLSPLGEALPYWSLIQIRTVKDPSSKVMMADASGSNFFGLADRDPTVAGMSRFGRSSADGLPPDPAQPFPFHRHLNGTANFLLLDGHVEGKTTWPPVMLGPGTYGYRFWHAEHIYPGSGHRENEEDYAP